MIIAIDGPAGSGKSSTARTVAQRLGGLYLDTGAMYRAIALMFIRRDFAFEPDNAQGVIADADIRFDDNATGQVVLLNGEDVTRRIRETDVTEASSRASQLVAVRKFMVAEQRRLASVANAAGRTVVMEGRDIGTVVFPEADFKFFMIADMDERVIRRVEQLKASGYEADLERIRAEMTDRDRRDESRALSPLTKANDAIEIDTSRLTFEKQVELVLAHVGGNA